MICTLAWPWWKRLLKAAERNAGNSERREKTDYYLFAADAPIFTLHFVNNIRILKYQRYIKSK